MGLWHGQCLRQSHQSETKWGGHGWVWRWGQEVSAASDLAQEKVKSWLSPLEESVEEWSHLLRPRRVAGPEVTTQKTMKYHPIHLVHGCLTSQESLKYHQLTFYRESLLTPALEHCFSNVFYPNSNSRYSRWFPRPGRLSICQQPVGNKLCLVALSLQHAWILLLGPKCTLILIKKNFFFPIYTMLQGWLVFIPWCTPSTRMSKQRVWAPHFTNHGLFPPLGYTQCGRKAAFHLSVYNMYQSFPISAEIL